MSDRLPEIRQLTVACTQQRLALSAGLGLTNSSVNQSIDHRKSCIHPLSRKCLSFISVCVLGGSAVSAQCQMTRAFARVLHVLTCAGTYYVVGVMLSVHFPTGVTSLKVSGAGMLMWTVKGPFVLCVGDSLTKGLGLLLV